MTGKWYGDPPTRAEVLAELASLIIVGRTAAEKAFGKARDQSYARVDCLLAARDYIAEHWPRDAA